MAGSSPGVAGALLLLAMGAQAALAAPAKPATPVAGDYAAQLCVSLPDRVASCGPVQARLGRHALRLQLGDIEYRLALRGNQLDVTLMHGTMQIDAFSAAFDWSGDKLRFGDADKHTLYEVQLGARQGAAK